jgi:hypothetical protein
MTMRVPVLLALCVVAVIACVPAAAWAADTQPAGQGAERAEQLKAAIKTFALSLDYEGPEDKPFYRLHLTVQPVMEARSNQFVRKIRLTEEQAGKIIDWLLADGFLDRAPDVSRRNAIRAASPESCYVLSVEADLKAGRVKLQEDLGWGLAMLTRMDALRKVLADVPAATMDFLLGRLSGYRAQWTKGGWCFEKDGLAVAIAPTKPVFAAGEALSFAVTLKNTSAKDLTLLHEPSQTAMWDLQFQGSTAGLQCRAMWMSIRAPDTRTDPLVLKAGQTREFKLTVGAYYRFLWTGGPAAKNVPVPHLQPGKWQLWASTACAAATKDRTETGVAAPWTGQITAGPVAFEISPPAKEK